MASDRRAFLRTAAALGGTALGFSSLQRRAQTSPPSPWRLPATESLGGYGPLQPAGPELALPRGFKYVTLGVEGSLMSDGIGTPRAHDGMAAFGLPNGNIRLIRNHEDGEAAATARARSAPAYDAHGGGGTTSLEVDPRTRRVVRDFLSLAGTIVNCAGGATPWGTWLSCEETTEGLQAGYTRPHGYVFEVAAVAEGPVDPVPLVAMGRFEHEAVAVDPGSGIIYLTEDHDGASVGSGLYRFLPVAPGTPGRPADLRAGGRLQMLAIDGRPGYDTRRGQEAGHRLPVRWVDIAEPDPADAESRPSAVFDQGLEAGGAVFSRLEGCFFADGMVYFDATNGGDLELGQLWAHRPGTERVELVYESRDPAVLRSPDNICVSPRGGIVVCEDPPSRAHVRGITSAGQVFDFARNVLNDREFAGATFSPDGRTLFVNIQGDVRPGDPGNRSMTCAVWGPWERGAL